MDLSSDVLEQELPAQIDSLQWAAVPTAADMKRTRNRLAQRKHRQRKPTPNNIQQ